MFLNWEGHILPTLEQCCSKYLGRATKLTLSKIKTCMILTKPVWKQSKILIQELLKKLTNLQSFCYSITWFKWSWIPKHELILQFGRAVVAASPADVIGRTGWNLNNYVALALMIEPPVRTIIRPSMTKVNNWEEISVLHAISSNCMGVNLRYINVLGFHLAFAPNQRCSSWVQT